MNDAYSIDKNSSEFLGVIKVVFRSAIKEFPKISIGFAFLAIISALLFTIGPKILQQIIDAIIARTDLKEFWSLFIFYGLCLLFGAVCKFGAQKTSFYIATQIEDNWRYLGLDHYYNLYLAWHDKHDSGEVGSKIDKGGSAVFVVIFELFGNNLLVSFITIIFIIAYTFWILPSFGWWLIAPLPIYVIVTFFISRKIAKGQAHLNYLAETSNRALYDGVGNVRTVKAFGKEGYEKEYYAKKWSGYHTFEYRVEKLFFIQDFIQTTIEITTRTALLIYCVFAAFKGYITVGQVILLINYQQMTFSPLAQLNQLFTRLRRNAKKVSRLFNIISESDKLKDKPDSVQIARLNKEILIKNVNFVYAGNIAALHNINLKIPAGTTTALVGKSGAGKSTFALLLMRFYDPEQGTITFDGINLRDIKRSSLRDQMTWIPQDVSLFNRTIKENIAYGIKNASQKVIEDAAKLAHAHEFILQTPKGYNSIIGERGVKLSGGQRQRLAIARALLKNPGVLIMDESTSHLDSETEKAISESIQNLRHKTTQIIIAHRLSTILHADQIVVFDKGKVLAVGKHKELLKNKIYKKLYDLQFHRKE
ncbi:ABC transporter ATP-binding protein [Candidatus Woesearchaeota archaeon]|nr:ABC transporter ATP-binding protein [Candidatus Woesearchaeota archaeon]